MIVMTTRTLSYGDFVRVDSIEHCQHLDDDIRPWWLCVVRPTIPEHLGCMSASGQCCLSGGGCCCGGEVVVDDWPIDPSSSSSVSPFLWRDFYVNTVVRHFVAYYFEELLLVCLAFAFTFRYIKLSIYTYFLLMYRENTD